MGYRVKPFTMSVRNNSTQEFVDVGLLGSDVDADIDEIKLKTSYVIPEMFGAVGDGETDDTIAIQTAINYCIENSKALHFLREHIYLITSQLNVTDYISIDGEFSTIKAGSLMNYILNFTIYPKYDDSGNTDLANRIDIEGHWLVTNLNLDCNSLAVNGLHTGGYLIYFSYINVRNVNNTGIVCGGISHLSQINVACNPVATSIGIDVASNDNVITDVVVTDAKKAIILRGYNRLQHITAWTKTKSQYSGSVFIHDASTSNLDYYEFIECYCDTIQIMFKADKRAHDAKFIGCRYQLLDDYVKDFDEDSYILYGVDGADHWFQNVNFIGCTFIGNSHRYTKLCNTGTCRANYDVSNTFIYTNGVSNMIYSLPTPPTGVTTNEFRILKQGSLTTVDIDVTINVPQTDASSNYNIVTLGTLSGYTKPCKNIDFTYGIRVTGDNEYFVTRFYGGMINATNGKIMLMIPNDLMNQTAMRATAQVTFINFQMHTMAVDSINNENT